MRLAGLAKVKRFVAGECIRSRRAYPETGGENLPERFFASLL